MRCVLADRNAAEIEPDELPPEFVVVAGHVDNARALPRLAQYLLHDVVVRLWPVKRLA